MHVCDHTQTQTHTDTCMSSYCDPQKLAASMYTVSVTIHNDWRAFRWSLIHKSSKIRNCTDAMMSCSNTS